MYPFKLHSNGVLAISPKNKPFLAETLNTGKVVAEPPEKELNELVQLFFWMRNYYICPVYCHSFAPRFLLTKPSG
jgi:hypothetical protein